MIDISILVPEILVLVLYYFCLNLFMLYSLLHLYRLPRGDHIVTRSRRNDWLSPILGLRQKKFMQTLARRYQLQSASIPLYFDDSFISRNDYWFKLFEDVNILLGGIATYMKKNKKQRSRSELFREFYIFTKLRINTSMALKAQTAAASFLLENFTTIFRDGDQEDLQSFEELLGKAEEYKDHLMDFTNSKFASKMHRFMLCLVSLSVFDKLGLPFDKLGYTAIEKAALKRKFTTMSIIETFADTLIFVCKTGYQVYVTRSPQVILHSEKTYLQWIEKVHDIYRRKKFSMNGNSFEEEYGEKFDELKMTSLIDSLVEQGKCILGYKHLMTKYELVKIRNHMDELKMIRSEMYTREAIRMNRKSPFSVMIYGNSGIGKSSVINMIYYYTCHLLKLDNGDHNKHPLNSNTKHFDGFTAGVHTLIIDDVAAKHPDKGEDKTIEYTIDIINNVPFVPPMADLENKGKIPFRGRLVIGTTNVKHMNAHKYFSHPSAAQRRFPFIITPKVRPEYLAAEGGRIDTDKLDSTSDYPDYWTFQIEKVICKPVDQLFQPASFRCIHTNLNLKEFLAWYKAELEKHENCQDKMVECTTRMQNASYCDSCSSPMSICDCELNSTPVEPIDLTWGARLTRCIVSIYEAIMDFLIYHIFNIIAKSDILRGIILRILTEKVFYGWGGLSLDRRMFRRIASRIRSHHFPWSKYLAAVAILASSFILYKQCFQSVQHDTQSEDISSGCMPTAQREEKNNVWYKDQYRLNHLDLTPPITSTKDLELGQFVNMIQDNCIHVSIERWDKGEGTRAQAVCLGGHKYLFNKHMLRVTENTTFTVVSTTSNQGVNNNMTFKVSPSQVTHLHHDLSVVTLQNLPPKKNITKYFPVNDIEIRTTGVYIGRQQDGSLEQNALNMVSFVPDLRAAGLEPVNSWKSTMDRPTRFGDCGKLLLNRSSMGWFIAGFHYAGNDHSAVAVSLKQSDFANVLNAKYNIQGGEKKFLSAPGYERHVKSLHFKSPLRYIEEGVANVYGTFTGFRSAPSSKVERSPMADYLEENTKYTMKYGKPEMKSWHPKRIALLDMVKPVNKLDQRIIDEVSQSYLDDILRMLTPGSLKELFPYDYFTTINGAAGVSYVDKINRGTSAGNPFKSSKRYFMEAAPAQHGLNDPVIVDPMIMKRVEEMEQTYIDGKRVYPNFCAHLKDEPVSFAKVESKKTRVFTGAPLDFTIVVRKYFLCFIRLIQNNRFAFEAGPGTIAQSTEWHHIYEYLTRFGKDQIIAGDYKAYDKRMPPQMILASFMIMIKLAELSGNFTDNDIKIMMGISEDTAYPLVDFFGDLIEFYGSNPSGHPLTVIINSICNSLYVRYCYHVLNPKHESTSFKDNVNLFTYGDDNIMGVSKTCGWFTHTTLAKALNDVDITYTMADKEAVSIPYINISEASFLKRTWRFEKELGHFVCPLEEESIEKMLMVWTRSSSIVWEEQVVAILTSANMEYFWYGKDIYLEKQKLFKNLVQSLPMSAEWIEPHVFPSWEDMCDKYYQSSGLVKQSEEYELPRPVVLPDEVLSKIIDFIPPYGFELGHLFDAYNHCFVVILPFRAMFSVEYRYYQQSLYYGGVEPYVSANYLCNRDPNLQLFYY